MFLYSLLNEEARKKKPLIYEEFFFPYLTIIVNKPDG